MCVRKVDSWDPPEGGEPRRCGTPALSRRRRRGELLAMASGEHCTLERLTVRARLRHHAQRQIGTCQSELTPICKMGQPLQQALVRPYVYAPKVHLTFRGNQCTLLLTL